MVFFKDAINFGTITFAFLFGVYKKLLVVKLMQYYKSLNAKEIKCIVIKPQLFELLKV